ncbi:MAG TPA: cytochrome c oxidase accessory protein CcoG [Cellvibrio sp.]|nr:cytochrome c oxidase accessory protein CcoG [Cellvibrio sp.]
MANPQSDALIPTYNFKEVPRRGAIANTGTIYTRSFKGRYRNIRILVASALALLFFVTSWLNWNGRQAVWWDLEQSRFYIFNATFWPQDLTFLSEIMIFSAFLLCAATVFAGRVWCGYSCPQSIWTWAFMWVEKISEGDRNQRIKLAAAPWSGKKIVKRAAKHSLWLLISLATGIAFIGYFVPVRELTQSILLGDWFCQSVFWVAVIASLTYINAGWLREKVCSHMCPYSRIQSAMLDKNTRVIAYNPARGENRGSRKREDDKHALGLGDCVDCSLCVQVCPTGIDIRDGLQMDCIGCAACIDVCDTVMDKMAYPRGLISYTSENQQQGQQSQPLLKRPQFLAYMGAAVLLLGFMAFTLYNRELADIGVAKDRTAYRINSQGQVVNVYRLKITNKTQQTGYYHLALADNNFAGDKSLMLTRSHKITLEPGEIYDLPVSVTLQGKTDSAGTRQFLFSLIAEHQSEPVTQKKAVFIYPKY